MITAVEGFGVDREGGHAGRSGPATAGTAVALLLAVGGAVVLHNGTPAPEGPWGPIALPLVWAMPGLLGVLARHRPVLLVPAAATAGVLALLSLSGVTLVLLVPGALLAAAAARRPVPWPGAVRTAALLALPAGGLAAFGALLVHEDPACWAIVRTPQGNEVERPLPDAECAGSSGTITVDQGQGVVGGGSTSDVVVAGEAGASGLLVAATLAVGWLAAGPSRAVARRLGPRRDGGRPPVWVTLLLVGSTGLLLTMGGAVVAAPATVPALLWAAHRHLRGWRRAVAAGVAALTAGELVWGLVYLAAGESEPAIWLAPLVAAVATALGAVPSRWARSMAVTASAGWGRANR